MKRLKQKSKQALSVLLALTLLCGLFAAVPVTAHAAGGSLRYINEHGASQTAENVSVLTDDSSRTLTAGWYAVTESFSADGRFTCIGDVRLILCDGQTMTAKKGFHVTGNGNSLAIYAQSTGSNCGKLVVDEADSSCAAIGGNNRQTLSVLTVNGGALELHGGTSAAGVGGGNGNRGSGYVVINGGTVTAEGGNGGAGIGGGKSGEGVNLTVNDGTVTATGGDGAAGVGSGENDDDELNAGDVTVNGGTFTAAGGSLGAGVGGGKNGHCGKIQINGGTVNAEGGEKGAGIGSGAVFENCPEAPEGGNRITITGGAVTAKGGDFGAGIGSGSWEFPLWLGEEAAITITGGDVNALGHDDAAAIGGNNCKVAVDGGRVTAAPGGFSSEEVITLSWTNFNDRIYASLYDAPVELKKEFHEENGDGVFPAGVVSNVRTIENKTLISTVPSYESNVPYIEADGTPKICPAAGYITADTSELYPGWYVVTENLRCTKRLFCTGDVKLILKDSTELRVCKGINVAEGTSLTVYAQSVQNMGAILHEAENMGAEAVAMSVSEAFIGGSFQENSGLITINGGRIVTAADCSNAACIGGGRYGTGTVVINNGDITTFPSKDAAAIGGGIAGVGNVTINGGRISNRYTTAEDSYGACIGGGRNAAGNVTINGGLIGSEGGNGAAIGGGHKGFGTVTINGGTVEAKGSGNGAAIGGGNNGGCQVIINGGSVNSYNVSMGAAIGTGVDCTNASSVTVNGGTVRSVSGVVGKAMNCTAETTVTLSWTNMTDSIYSAAGYSGAVTLQKDFTDGTDIFQQGVVSDNETIRRKTLKPVVLYTVKWVNDDGTVLQESRLQEGGGPAYTGAAPTKPAEGEEAFLFSGWSDGETVYPAGTDLPTVTKDVTYTAVYDQALLIPFAEPMINSEGAYIPGHCKHYLMNGKTYAVNADGSVGEELADVSISYFTFRLLNDDTYRITAYTGPVDNMTELVIPKTYGGKTITVLGAAETKLFDSTAPQFTLVLNENIKEISSLAFWGLNVRAVTGDTSGLTTIGRYAFSWVNGGGGFQLDITLMHKGTVSFGYYAFSNDYVTFHLLHETTIAGDVAGTQGAVFDFTDDHPYGEPQWTWANDHSAATATFTCTDTRCQHRETIEAAVNSIRAYGKWFHTAVVSVNGKMYTDVTTTFIDEIGASLAGYTLSLDGDIGVNFYMELSEEVAAHEDAFMRFTIPKGDGTVTLDVPVGEAATKEEGSNTYYIFKCTVPAKDMTASIRAQMIDGDRQGTVYGYSVKEYADYLLAHARENEEFARAADLVKKLLNYGAYAQLFFGKNTEALANDGLSDEDKALGEVTVAARQHENILPENVAFDGATLSLLTETTLSLYFISEEELTFSCGEMTVETSYVDGHQVARIRNIPAKGLQDDFTVTVTAGDNVFPVTFSPMDYCYNVLNGGTDDENLQNVVKAIVRYAEAADSYFI